MNLALSATKLLFWTTCAVLVAGAGYFGGHVLYSILTVASASCGLLSLKRAEGQDPRLLDPVWSWFEVPVVAATMIACLAALWGLARMLRRAGRGERAARDVDPGPGTG